MPASAAVVAQIPDERLHASGKAAAQDWVLPEQIVEKKEGRALDNHLFCDAENKFWTELNGWEKELLAAEMDKKDFVGWLRNFDRRDWSLCVPYDMGGIKGFYPDLIIIRKTSKGLIADILEPHNPSFVDTVPKAIGLAKFADEHGEEFGRIIIARKKGEHWQYADLQDKQSRERIKAMQPGTDVAKLFEA